MLRDRPELTKHQMQKIRKMHRIGIRVDQIAEHFGITENHVLMVIERKIK